MTCVDFMEKSNTLGTLLSPMEVIYREREFIDQRRLESGRKLTISCVHTQPHILLHRNY
jgi:hypothetical protein